MRDFLYEFILTNNAIVIVIMSSIILCPTNELYDIYVEKINAYAGGQLELSVEDFVSLS